MFSGQYETDEDTRCYTKILQIYVVKVYSSQCLKEILSCKQAQKTWETLRDMYRRELKKLDGKNLGKQ